MLRRLDHLASRRMSFAFESTLARQALARRLNRLRALGYSIHIVYLWLPTVELALAWVAQRVVAGGHDVPSEAVRRRFERGRHNFFILYRGLARTWRLYDVSPLSGPRLIARGGTGTATRIIDPVTWRRAAEGHSNE